MIVQIGPPTGLLAPDSTRPMDSILEALEKSPVPVARLIGWSESTPDSAPLTTLDAMEGALGEHVLPKQDAPLREGRSTASSA